MWSVFVAGIGISARPAGSFGNMLHHIGVPVEGAPSLFHRAIPE
jgi:hypothetical protein